MTQSQNPNIIRILSYFPLAIILTAQFLKQLSQQAAVFSIVATLMVLGLVILWDQDRWRKAGISPGPFWMHVTALGIGCLSGWLSSQLYGIRTWWWLGLFFQTFQMLIFFVLLELATDKRMRRQAAYGLHSLSCAAAHMMVITHPLFDIKTNFVDWFLVGIIGTSLISGSIDVLKEDLDPQPLERRYVFLWAAISSVTIGAWRFLAVR